MLLLVAFWPMSLTAPPVGISAWASNTLLVALAILLALKPVEISPGRKLSAASAAVVALAILYPPLWAALCAGIAGIASQVFGRRHWYATVFNVSQRTLAVLAAAVTCQLLSQGLGTPVVVACVPAAAVYFLTNTACVSAMAAARQERSWGPSWWAMVRDQWSNEIGLLAGGVLIAIHLQYAPIALPLLLPMLWLAWRVVIVAAEIRQLNTRLSTALDHQRRFVTDASHELRTPIASLRAQLDTLLRHVSLGGDELLRRRVEEMTNETARVTALLADLMVLAHADEGAPLAMATVNLEEVLVASYREARPLAGQVDFRLTLDDAFSAELFVMADQERLRQLFLNLMTNALRYTPSGGCVEVECRSTSENVAVQVRDTGVGISSDDLPLIFDRFYRAGTDRARDGDPHAAGGLGGSGLGLSIAKWIVDAHGGSFNVESEVGRGSIFTVTLPLSLTPAQPASEEIRSADRAASAVAT